jgi:hypothetical protein
MWRGIFNYSRPLRSPQSDLCSLKFIGAITQSRRLQACA